VADGLDANLKSSIRTNGQCGNDKNSNVGVDRNDEGEEGNYRGVFDYLSSSSSDNDDDEIEKSNSNHHRCTKSNNYEKNSDVHHSSSNKRSISKTSAVTTTTKTHSRTSSTSLSTSTSKKNTTMSNDERWMDNFNLLRKCLNPIDGTINYTLLERDDDDSSNDDEDEDEVLKKRLRNFVKEQRRQYSIKSNTNNSSSSGGGGGRSNSNSNCGMEERIRLLTEVGFNFRPSDTTTTNNKGKRCIQLINSFIIRHPSYTSSTMSKSNTPF
jgi:hypothetical protein